MNNIVCPNCASKVPYGKGKCKKCRRIFPRSGIYSVTQANNIWTAVSNQREKPKVRQETLAKLFFDTGGLKGELGKVTGVDIEILDQIAYDYCLLHPSGSEKISHMRKELRHAMHYANTSERISVESAKHIYPDSDKYVYMFQKDYSKSNYY